MRRFISITVSLIGLWPLIGCGDSKEGPVSFEKPVSSKSPSASTIIRTSTGPFRWPVTYSLFLRDTIDSWPVNPSTGQPTGLAYDVNNVPHLVLGAQVGVCQKLATCNFGEVISQGDY